MFTPPKHQLEKYADILVNFALNSGKGIRKDDVVYLVSQLPGLPLAKETYRAIIRSGGNCILKLIDDSFQLIDFDEASDRQLRYFPEKFYRGLADNINQWIRILSYEDPMYLKDADKRKVIMSTHSGQQFRNWLDKKEDRGIFTWTLCVYGTAGMAKEAGLSEKEYWGQIAKACFLNEKNPVAKWREVFTKVEKIMAALDDLPIKELFVKAKDTDLRMRLGEKRKWLGGSGRNIPSFEIFTSPDWRGTEGKISFDLPLYRYGNLLKDIRLEFRGGKVVRANAGRNEKFLREMIKEKNADKIGEFSLTDRRFSRIDRFMANSLFDENFGGKFGNTHLAVGRSYHDTFRGDAKKLSPKEWQKLGFNHSSEHTDIISTTDRTVKARLKDGSIRTIYEGGEFTV